MAQNFWKLQGSGNWDTATNWTTGTVPGTVPANGDDVFLDYSQLSGFTGAYTVTILPTETYDLSDLTISGISATSPITLANSGTLLVLDQLKLNNASLSDGKSLTVGTFAFNGDALLTLDNFATASGQLTSSGSNEVVQNFGSEFVGASANFGGQFTWVLQGDSQASFSGQVSGAAATFIFADNTADELTLGSSQGNQLFSAISSFSGSNEIDLRGLSFSTGPFTTSSHGTDLVINTGVAPNLQPQFTFDAFSFGPGYNLSDVRYASDGNGGTIVSVVCFAAGTRIAAELGEVAVEDLRAGDRVVTLEAGSEVLQTVHWVGRRRIKITGHPGPEAVAPIRIQRDAFAEGVPHRDLVVSPDHAICVDGKLICARQLANGTTVRQELDWTAVDYYHVKLEEHAILLAEGLPAESYLDTGNSGFFENSGAPLVLHPDLTDGTDCPSRVAGSCLPFVWDEASVLPVWQHLADRAVAIGLVVPQRATTTDADLRLRGSNPERNPSKPIYADSNLAIFVLPRGTEKVRLLSRAQSPTEARPWLDDRRRLGVRVKRIVLRGPNELREIPMDHPDLTRGWWAIEHDGQMMSRWTDGDAVVPLPKMDSHAMLEIHLAGEMVYAVEAEPERPRPLASASRLSSAA
jgi:hypothetical protein